jgi:hypothetical protein
MGKLSETGPLIGAPAKPVSRPHLDTARVLAQAPAQAWRAESQPNPAFPRIRRFEAPCVVEAQAEPAVVSAPSEDDSTKRGECSVTM